MMLALPYSPLCSVSVGKGCFIITKLILTSERRAENQFAGQNAQQTAISVKIISKFTLLIFLAKAFFVEILHRGAVFGGWFFKCHIFGGGAFGICLVLFDCG